VGGRGYEMKFREIDITVSVCPGSRALFYVPISSFGIVGNNGREGKLKLNLGRTENTLSQEMETRVTVSLNPFMGKEFLKLACD
jgi:hypothetical protein